MKIPYQFIVYFVVVYAAAMDRAQSKDQEKAFELIIRNGSVNLTPGDSNAPLLSAFAYDNSTGETVISDLTSPTIEAIMPIPTISANDVGILVECDDSDKHGGSVDRNDNRNNNNRPSPSDRKRCRRRRNDNQESYRKISLRMKPPITTAIVTTTVAPPTTTKFRWTDCKCEGYTCKCCAHLNFPAIKLDKDICITFVYDPEQVTLEVAVDIGGWVVYRDEISALHPKSICYDLPYTFNFGRLCAKLTDVNITPNSISGCFRVFAKLLGARVGETKVGCWELGPFPVPWPIPTTSTTTTTTPGTTTSPKPFDCSCQGYTCKCCAHLKWTKINLDKLACISFTYDPEGITLTVKLDLSGKVLIEKSISALDPPPICIGLPYVNNFAAMCVQMYDGKLEKDSFSGCFMAYAQLFGKIVGETKLGCFSIPLNSGKSQSAAVRSQ